MKPASDTNPKPAPGARERLLAAAFEEMYETGFTGLRVDRVIESAHATKGAFYHHFSSKSALGYAVVDEILTDLAREVWGEGLARARDPVAGILTCVEEMFARLGPRAMAQGCPYNNLAQEMSATDAGFRTRLGAIFGEIVAHIAAALERGKATGQVRAEIDSAAVAQFIFATLEGAIGLAKAMGEAGDFHRSLGVLRGYMESLRPAESGAQE